MKTKKEVLRDISLFMIAWLIAFASIVVRGDSVGQEQTKVTETNINSFANYRVLNVENMALKHQSEKVKELDESNYIGEFEITYYTAGFESCGKLPSDPAYGITKSGEPVKENYTIAADLSILPLGTKIYVENIGIRVVTDSGFAIVGNKLDNYVENLEDIPSIGRHMAKVYLLD